MTMIRSIFVFFLFMVSFNSLADTYLAQTKSVDQVCAEHVTNMGYGSFINDGLNPDQWTNYKCRFFNTSGVHVQTLANLYAYLYCPSISGGTLSGSNCINAPACSSGQIRNTTTGECSTPPPPTCASNQYVNASNQCAAIPDCNVNSIPSDGNTLGGGKYFNSTTNQCVDSGLSAVCQPTHPELQSVPYNPLNIVFCPTIVDCQPVGTICTDKPALNQLGMEIKGAEVLAATNKASANESTAISTLNSALTAATSKQAVVTAAQTQVDQAKAVLDQIYATSGSTIEQMTTAAKTYSDAVSNLSQKTAQAANSVSASSSAAAAKTDIQSISAFIPDSPSSSYARNYGDWTDQLVARALTALADAVSGLGSGTGTGQGASSENCEQSGACSSPLTPYSLADHEQGSFDTEAANSELEAVKNEFTNLFETIKSEVSEVLDFGVTGGTASLPVYDFGTIKGVAVAADLNQYSDQLSVLADIFIFLAYLTAFFMILGVNRGGD